MKIRVSQKAVGDHLIAGVYEGQKTRGVPAYFSGKLGQVEVVGKNIYAGLGKKDKLDLEAVRTAAAAAIKKACQVKAGAVSTELYGAVKAIVEGSLLGVYKFTGYATKKEEPEHEIKELVLVVKDRKKMASVKKEARLGSIIAEAENWARDLVNMPANRLTPKKFTEVAQKIARINKLKFTSIDPKKAGMFALWAVAKGSDQPPRLVALEYRGAPRSKQKIALIGKGITFDSGGISLKPSSRMYEMKCDMSGAAAVLGVMSLLNDLKPKVNVLAVLPLTENMPSGHATKPGDVVGSLSGMTIEVINTDAEGRMILVDAVTYAKKQKATALVDIATLTGGCVVALGDAATGVIGNDQKLIDEIVKAGNESGQRMWQLPLYDEYKETLKSTVADIKNTGESGKAQPSTGAAFIEKFVGDTPWVHLDIAGTAFLGKARGYLPEGATGVPVRTLIEWLNAK